MAITSAFQADDAGSIPVIPSINTPVCRNYLRAGVFVFPVRLPGSSGSDLSDSIRTDALIFSRHVLFVSLLGSRCSCLGTTGI